MNKQQRKYKREQTNQFKSNFARFKADQEKLAEQHGLPECSICLVHVSHDHKILKCGHVFHKTCVSMVRNNQCPLCKGEIRKPREAHFVVAPQVDGYIQRQIESLQMRIAFLRDVEDDLGVSALN